MRPAVSHRSSAIPRLLQNRRLNGKSLDVLVGPCKPNCQPQRSFAEGEIPVELYELKFSIALLGEGAGATVSGAVAGTSIDRDMEGSTSISKGLDRYQHSLRTGGCL